MARDERHSERKRLDALMVERGLAPSRSRARDLARGGAALVDGRVERRPGRRLADGARIELAANARPWVSRAALKLEAAFDAFALDCKGRVALDLGASTGGFSQLLLARGARRVHAVDVGHGQLHESLRREPRLVVHEGVNARYLELADIGERAGFITADLSFISLRTALAAPLLLAAPDCALCVLVKPQFELGREHVGKSGVVRDMAQANRAVDLVGEWLVKRGWRLQGSVISPIRGQRGNREFLLVASLE
jgi:23S rRNA (cytidine1920-2'-O)/16S rRNA (cytidine1409-2'-O)-methyltransferase